MMRIDGIRVAATGRFNLRTSGVPGRREYLLARFPN
jgi:hypothetical protein